MKISTWKLLMCAPVLLAACSSTPIAETSAPTTGSGTALAPAARVVTAVAPPTKGPTAQSTVSTVSLPAYLDPQSFLFKSRTVYFDYDEFAIKPAYVPLVEQHGKYLADHPLVTLHIEGRTDERGGAEYNLALGQKRAEAVRHSLEIYGVKGAQMEAVSYGKEKPLVAGHDEAAWAQNRRADLEYPRK